MTEDVKEDDKLIIGHDSETVRKETYQNENQEGAPENPVPNDFYITLDEYSDGNESEVNGIKQEIRIIWEYCDLIWDIHKEEKQRIDHIELSLKNKIRQQIKAMITLCDLSPQFFCNDATLLCEFESDKI